MSDLNTGEFFVWSVNALGVDLMYRYIGKLPIMASLSAKYVWSVTHQCSHRNHTNLPDSHFTAAIESSIVPLVDDDWMRANDFLPRVLTLVEAQERVAASRSGRYTVLSSSKYNAMFFSNDHCHGLRVEPNLDSSWVPCSGSLPHSVVARPSIPDGMIKNVQEYVALFCPDETIIETQAQLDEIIARGPIHD